ncbi:hypothetical protein ABW19_dt0210569 [Dactylella cylindrospora]|nr:hypothetical protein ABW19_dt0210569 [Dactylella cylindrospora]
MGGDPDLNSYPEMETLIQGMGGDNRTDGWDVTVSYNIAKLNTFLRKKWTARPESDGPIEFTVPTMLPYIGPCKQWKQKFHKYKAADSTWNFKVGAPTLQFSAEQRAVLSMEVSGEITTQEYVVDEPADPEHPPHVKEIPVKPNGPPSTDPISDGWVVKVNTPISAVKAYDSDIIERKPVGEVLDLSDDPNHQGHIVFDFGIEGQDTATVAFEWEGEGDPDEGDPDGSAIQTADAELKKKLPALEFSVASVNQKKDEGVTYLTPNQMVFAVYAPSPLTKENRGIACLSVYIQTKESGNKVGTGEPKFKTNYNSGSQNTYPIPDGYSASIIINSDLFWDTLVWESIKASKNSAGDGTPFFDLPGKMPKSSQEGTGLSVQLKWNILAPHESSSLYMPSWWDENVSDGWWYDVDQDDDLMKFEILYQCYKDEVEAAFTNCNSYHEGAELLIDDKGNMLFKPNVDVMDLKWDYFSLPGIKTHWGHVHYQPLMASGYSARNVLSLVPDPDPSKPPQINASYYLDTNDYTYTAVEQGSDTKNYFGVTEWVKRFEYPTFSGKMRLDFFATQNVFAPGTSPIKISTDAGLRVPHDILLVGDVVDPDD